MPLDLRKSPCDDVVRRVSRAFATQFDPNTEVRKRRSLGCRTDRDTWVRIEARPVEKIDGQGWNGPECAAVMSGVAKPDWYRGVSWLDADQQMMWRADESQLIESPPIKPGGLLTTDPNLSDAWWATLTSSLRALAMYPTTRLATPTMQPITEERLAAVIHKLFPEVETHVEEWTTAHGDLFWTNLTAPDCWLLDWEDWGQAPRGYDAASLWHSSLAVPALAERVQHELRTELDSRSGKLAQLYHCAEIIGDGPKYGGRLFEPAQAAARQLLTELA
jgi:hypothetical protein